MPHQNTRPYFLSPCLTWFARFGAYRPLLVLIVLLGLAFRLWLVAGASGTLQSDARDYHALARNLWLGHGYSQEYRGESPEYLGLRWQAYRSPGYPIVLAAIGYLHGDGPQPGDLLLVGIVADMVALVALLSIAVRLFGARSALVTAGLFSLLPLWTVQGGTESLFIAVVALAFWILLATKRPFIPGILLAFAYLVRPMGLVFFVPAVLLLWYYRRGEVTQPRIGLLFVPLILVAATWTMRNQIVLGQPIVMTTNGPLHALGDSGVDRQALVERVRAAGGGEVAIYDAAKGALRTRYEEMSLSELGSLYTRRFIDLLVVRPPHELRVIQWRFILAPTSYQVLALQLCLHLIWIVYLLALYGSARGYKDVAIQGIVLTACLFLALHSIISRGDIRLGWPVIVLALVVAGSAFRSRSAP